MTGKSLYPYISLLVIICISLFLQLALLGAGVSERIVLSNTLDLSWQTDMTERLLHGYLAGRDFIFTYGPLAQILYAIPAILFDQPSYIAVLFAPLLLSLFNIFLLYVTLKLATREEKISIVITALLFFVIGLVLYDQNSLFRALLPFLYGLLLFRFVSVTHAFSFRTVAIFSLPAIFGLFTFDIFILCTLITIFFLLYELYTAFQKKKNRLFLTRYSLKGGTFILVIVLFTLLISFLLSGNLNYLIYSFDTVKNYQFVMNIPWSINNYTSLFVFPLALSLFLLYLLKQPLLTTDQKKSFTLLTIIALLQIKSALIRSDDGHIVMGIYPSLIVLFTLFFFTFKKKLAPFLVAVFIVLYFFIPVRFTHLQSLTLQNLSTGITLITSDKPFFSVYRFPENYYFNQQDFDVFASYITKNPGKVMMYPYDTYILNAYNQTYNTLALQFYQYANSIVEAKTVENLKNNPPSYVILGIDDKGAVRLDNIPNFSRNPLLAKWMIQNYSVEKEADNYLILRFDANKTGTHKLKSCIMYDIGTNEIMNTNISERVLKSSTYYLDTDSGIRLPYMPDIKEVLIVEQYNDSSSLQKIFESSSNFEQDQLQKKKIKVIKKSPIPFFKQIYEMEFLVKCYS